MLGYRLLSPAVVLPINMQDYGSKAVLKVFPMNSNLHVILGRDWCNHAFCDVLYSAGLMIFSHHQLANFTKLYYSQSVMVLYVQSSFM